MRSLSFGGWIAHLADIILTLYMGQSWWDWSKKGEHLKKLFESGITKWVQARADAEISKEVVALQKFFIKSSIVLFIIPVLVGSLFRNVPVVEQISASLIGICFISMIGYSSLEWTFQHRATIQSFVGIKAFVILTLAMMMAALATRKGLEQIYTNIWQANGWSILPEPQLYFLIALTIFISVGLFVLFSYIMGWVFFGGVSFLIVGILLSLPYTCFLLNGDMKLHRNWHFFI